MGKIELNDDVWYKLNLELGNLIIFSAFSNEKLNKQFPELKTIYHYTTLNGLISIIENQTFYCTNIYYMNDKEEYKYGVSQINKVIKHLKSNDYNINILEKVENNINLIYQTERFATCFSKNGDLLSQWRAYANQGKGVAIGFNVNNFAESINQHIEETHIEYDKAIQIQVIEESIKLIIEFFNCRKITINWGKYEYEFLVAKEIIKFLGILISSYKHPSFIEEQEYRFQYEIDGINVVKEDEELFLRASDTLIIPYIKLKTKYRQFLEDKKSGSGEYCNYGCEPAIAIKQLPINKIIIGPSLDFETVKIGIEELLKKNNYDDILIEKSSIPYRL